MKKSNGSNNNVPYRQEDARRHGHLESPARQEENYERDQRQKRHGAGQGQHYGRGPQGWVRSDERILEEINERLSEDTFIDAREMRVEIKNGEVSLKGTVESQEVKQKVAEIAESVLGVSQVRNELQVV